MRILKETSSYATAARRFASGEPILGPIGISLKDVIRISSKCGQTKLSPFIVITLFSPGKGNRHSVSDHYDNKCRNAGFIVAIGDYDIK